MKKNFTPDEFHRAVELLQKSQSWGENLETLAEVLRAQGDSLSNIVTTAKQYYQASNPEATEEQIDVFVFCAGFLFRQHLIGACDQFHKRKMSEDQCKVTPQQAKQAVKECGGNKTKAART